MGAADENDVVVDPEAEAVDTAAMTIHERLARILGELPAIGKDAFNEQQRFHYRSHDDVLNALNPLLAKYGVFVVPEVKKRIQGERKTRSGGLMYEVNLLVQYSFYAAGGGDPIVASAWGEGTDSGDKSTNKAMTMAFKNVLAQVFAVSTADTLDSDSDSPEETVGRTSGRPRAMQQSKLADLEQLIEEVKALDSDEAHGGGYYYQVAVNAAAKYHNKRLEDLSVGEIADLERRFRGLIADLGGADNELPVEETVAVQRGPEPISAPGSWAELEEAIRAYGEPTWNDFQVFLRQARDQLFPGAERMSSQRKAVLFQKASGVMIKLRESHSPDEFPPPSRVEFQGHWALQLEGAVLAGPDWAMSPDETDRPQRSGEEEADAQAPEAEGAVSPVSEPQASPVQGSEGDETEGGASPPAAPPAPSEPTFTDTPLTDAEQALLDQIGEVFEGADEVPTTDADAAGLEKAPAVEVDKARPE